MLRGFLYKHFQVLQDENIDKGDLFCLKDNIYIVARENVSL